MSRTKGAKNKMSARTAEEKIAAVTMEMEELQRKLKEKKDELKRLKEEKEKEDSRVILAAAAENGRSVEEVLALIRAGRDNSHPLN